MAAQRVVRNISIIVIIGLVLVVGGCLSIFIPYILTFQLRAKMTKAEAEINSIETALTAVLADANVRDLRSLVNHTAFKRACDVEMKRSGTDAIAASIEIYSTTALALMKHGNATGDVLGSSDDTKHLADLIPRDFLRSLGNSYMDELAADPWGETYRFFFGPWPEDLGPIVFRTYIDNTTNTNPDRLTVTLRNSGSTPRQVGFRAPTIKPFYIWSLGKNKRSDQAIFDPTGKYPPLATQHYRLDAPPELMGGGDDINNWDKTKSYFKFYPSQRD